MTSVVQFQAMRNTLANRWHPLGGIEILDLGENRYLFCFIHQVDIERVIKVVHWSLNNHLLVFHRMQDMEDPILVPLFCTHFWVQMHDLPRGFISR